MSETLAPEEAQARSVAEMPTGLGNLYYELQKQLAWLHLKWKDFRGLCASDPKTVDLLNAAAPAFFHNLQRMMWEDVLLHLCRLTDRGKSTLTIRRLPALIPHASLRDQAEKLADDARMKTDFARDWRNRRLAHRELPPLDGQSARPLAAASLRHVEDALAALRETLNCIERHYLQRSVGYEHSIEALGGVKLLIRRLEKALDAERAERKRLLGE